MNKPVKFFLRNEFQTWYAKEVCSQLQGQTESEPVDLKLSVVKPMDEITLVNQRLFKMALGKLGF